MKETALSHLGHGYLRDFHYRYCGSGQSGGFIVSPGFRTIGGVYCSWVWLATSGGVYCFHVRVRAQPPSLKIEFLKIVSPRARPNWTPEVPETIPWGLELFSRTWGLLVQARRLFFQTQATDFSDSGTLWFQTWGFFF